MREPVERLAAEHRVRLAVGERNPLRAAGEHVAPAVQRTHCVVGLDGCHLREALDEEPRQLPGTRA